MESARQVSRRTASEALDRQTHEIALLMEKMLRIVAELDRREVWRAQGETSMVSWLANHRHMGWDRGRACVRWARVLENKNAETTTPAGSDHARCTLPESVLVELSLRT